MNPVTATISAPIRNAGDNQAAPIRCPATAPAMIPAMIPIPPALGRGVWWEDLELGSSMTEALLKIGIDSRVVAQAITTDTMRIKEASNKFTVMLLSRDKRTRGVLHL